MAGDMFVFELLEGDTVIQRCKINPISGSEATFTFAPITYTKAGSYRYTVREVSGNIKGVTYDAAPYTVNITVTEDGHGGLTSEIVRTVDGNMAESIVFTNTYIAEGTLSLTAQKTVNGAEPAANQLFTFTLSDEDGEIETVQNTLGKISFTRLTYTQDDVGMHTYTVRESSAVADYVTDGTVYTITVRVTDHGDGTLLVTPVIWKDGETVTEMAFDNKLYAPLTISKKVEGCMTAEVFPITVWIYDAQGKEVKTSFAYTGDVSGTLVSGEAIKLGHNQAVTIKGLTPGMRYKLEEAEDPRFTTTVNALAMNTVEGEVTEGGNSAAFVNTLITTSFSVKKEWQGEYGGSIILTLYADGEKLTRQPACEQSGNVYTYTDLPMYNENGRMIIYSAKEKYMDGYLTIYDNVKPFEEVTDFIHNGGTIINRSAMDFKVQKVWTGLEEGETSPEITLVLYCNGEVYDRETPEPDEYGWYKYYNLPIFVNGERAEYSVVEETLDGYATTYTNNGKEGECACNGGVITNHKLPETGDNAPLMQWTAMLGASAAALLMLVCRRKRT